MTSAALSRTFDDVTIPVPGVYEIDQVHTLVVFRVRHLVLGRVVGRFDSFQGELTVIEDAERLFGEFEVTFDAGAVDTQVAIRDDDLRSARFFDVASFPTVTLSGADSRHGEGNRWTVDGELTIRDVTQPVSMDVIVRGVVLDSHGNTKVTLGVVTTLQRSDFDLTAELIQESGESGSGPDVEVETDVEATLRG